MSIEAMQTAMSLLSKIEIWNAYALHNKQRVHGREYTSCPICFSNPNDLKDYIGELKTFLLEKVIPAATSVEEYSGFNEQTAINKIRIDNELIADNYKAIQASLIRNDDEANIMNFNSNAFVITGATPEDCPTPLSVTFIAIKNPIKSFKKTVFRFTENCFKPVTDKYLDLPLRFDLIIINETIYMMSLIGETLFDLERTHKILCNRCVKKIESLDIVCDADAFKAVAASSHNPRRFLTFSQTRLEHVNDLNNRRIIGRMFNIALNAHGIFDTTDPKASERLIKFLCEKAMEDPVDHSAKEVPVARAWS